jgi:hypothetical protein
VEKISGQLLRPDGEAGQFMGRRRAIDALPEELGRLKLDVQGVNGEEN